MKTNDYESAEVVEIGNAQTVILGWKDGIGFDSSCGDPIERLYHE